MVEKAIENFTKNTQAMVGLFVGAIVVFGGWGLWSQNKESKELQARALYTKAEKTLESQLIALAPPAPKEAAPSKDPKAKPKPAPEDSDESKVARARYVQFNVNEKLADALAAMREVQEKFPGTQAAWDASLTIAQLYVDHGSVNDSITWFEKAQKNAQNEMDRAITWYGLGSAHERMSQWTEALAAYQKALSEYERAYPKPKTSKSKKAEETTLPSAFAPEIRFGMVRAQTELKQFDAAKALLEQMKSDGPAAGPLNRVEQLVAWVSHQESVQTRGAQ